MYNNEPMYNNEDVREIIDAIQRGCIDYKDIPSMMKSDKYIIKAFIENVTSYEELYHLLNDPTVGKFNNDWEIMLSAASIDSRFVKFASYALQRNTNFRKNVNDNCLEQQLTQYNVNRFNEESQPEKPEDRIRRSLPDGTPKHVIITIPK